MNKTISKSKNVFLSLFLILVSIFSCLLFIPLNSTYCFEYNGVTYSDKVFVIRDWIGVSNFNGQYVWSDGTNCYLSTYNYHYILDLSTSTWSNTTFNGYTYFFGSYIWSDGFNTYLSDGSSQYVFDVSTSTWSAKSWTGLRNFAGSFIKKIGDNFYYSNGNVSYVLDISTSTWSLFSFYGLSGFNSTYVWSDGTNYYYSLNNTQYILDLATFTWNIKVWEDFIPVDSSAIWNDGVNTYYSRGTSQYVLDTSLQKFVPISFTNIKNFNGYDIWKFNDCIYYSASYKHGQFIDFDDLLDTGGYDLGYSDGYSAGSIAGYDSGYSAGESAGYDTGYDVGYDTGYDDGETSGYNDGFIQGESAGYDNGYSNGYDNGYYAYSNLGFFPYSSFNVEVYGRYIWFDGTYYHYDRSSMIPEVHYVFNPSSSEWVVKEYNISLNGDHIWTDGTNIYYSDGTDSYIYNSSLDIFQPFTFNGLTDINPLRIFTLSSNIYFSYGDSIYYILDTSTYTWSLTTFVGDVPLDISINRIVEFNDVVYAISESYLYSLVLPSNSWTKLSYTGLSSNEISLISSNSYLTFGLWCDSDNLYLSCSQRGSNQYTPFNYVLNTSTYAFSRVTWALNDNVDVLGLYDFYGVKHMNYNWTYNSVDYDSYDAGYQVGYTQGKNYANNTINTSSASYNAGYNNGVNDAGEYTFFGLFGAVIDAPVQTFTNLFNFELLGVNLLGFFLGLLSLAVILFILKLVLGGR